MAGGRYSAKYSLSAMWYKIQEQQVQLRIFVKPNAKRSALLAVGEKELQISLHAKPQDGKANQELLNYLAELLDLPKTQLHLERGEASRHKVVSLPLTLKTQRFLAYPAEFISKK